MSDDLPEDILKAIAKSKGRRPPKKGAPGAALPFADAAAQRAQGQAAAALAALKPGDVAPDGSFYLGIYTPLSRRGRPLGKTFNVFAAPEGIEGGISFKSARQRLRHMKEWNGYGGAPYRNDRAFYRALKWGRYRGKWVVPPLEILHGKNEYSGAEMQDSLFRHRHTGAFNASFGIKPYSGLESHLSSTILRGVYGRDAVNVYMCDHMFSGQKSPIGIDNALADHLRLVRLVECAPDGGPLPPRTRRRRIKIDFKFKISLE